MGHAAATRSKQSKSRGGRCIQQAPLGFDMFSVAIQSSQLSLLRAPTPLVFLISVFTIAELAGLSTSVRCRFSTQ